MTERHYSSRWLPARKELDHLAVNGQGRRRLVVGHLALVQTVGRVVLEEVRGVLDVAEGVVHRLHGDLIATLARSTAHKAADAAEARDTHVGRHCCGVFLVCATISAGALRNRGYVGGGARAGAAPACDAAAQGKGRRRGGMDGAREADIRQRHLEMAQSSKAPRILLESGNNQNSKARPFIQPNTDEARF